MNMLGMVIVVVVFMVMIIGVSGAAARSTVVLLTFIIFLAYILLTLVIILFTLVIILFTLIMIFSTFYTSFAVFIETVSTQDVTELTIFVKAINTLAAVVTLPTISSIQICGFVKECAVKVFIIIRLVVVILFLILAASHTVYVKTGRRTKCITELAILVKAIYALAAIFALPAVTIVWIGKGNEEFAFLVFSKVSITVFIILFFAFRGVFFLFTAFLAVDVESSRCTEGVTGFTVVIKAIDTLASVFALPSVAIVRIFEGGKEFALFFFLIIRNAASFTVSTQVI